MTHSSQTSVYRSTTIRVQINNLTYIFTYAICPPESMTVYARSEKSKHLLIIYMAPQEPGTSQQTHQALKSFSAHGATPVSSFQYRALHSDARTAPVAGQIARGPVAVEVSCAAIGGPALAPGYPGRHGCRSLSVGGHRAVGVIRQLYGHKSTFLKDSAGVYWQTSEFLNAVQITSSSSGGPLLGRCCFTGRNELKEMPASRRFCTKDKSFISVEYLQRISTTTPRRC